jgi:hypothetical protein
VGESGHARTAIDRPFRGLFEPSATRSSGRPLAGGRGRPASSRCTELANGRCAATLGPRLAFTSARVPRAWCRGWLWVEAVTLNGRQSIHVVARLVTEQERGRRPVRHARSRSRPRGWARRPGERVARFLAGGCRRHSATLAALLLQPPIALVDGCEDHASSPFDCASLRQAPQALLPVWRGGRFALASFRPSDL